MKSIAAAKPIAGRASNRRPPAVSFFEFWPGWIFHLPVVVQWFAFGARYGDLSLLTAANPCIETGGLCGESKGAILDQMAQPARDLVARYTCVDINGHNGEDAACAAMQLASLMFPLVVKPDIGCNGTGVQLVSDSAALSRYIAAFPHGRRLMLQEYVSHDNEAGIFYIREPGAARGQITSITYKHPPIIVGDGHRTLRQLVCEHPRFGRKPGLFLSRVQGRLDAIPRSGDRVQLLFVGNHCKGSLFEDGTHDATAALLEAVEGVARALPEFYFGRIDVRFISRAKLRAGTGFRILEVNGVGAEATHVWDPAMSLAAAWRSELAHFGAAWRIGAVNRRRGHRSSGFRQMFNMWRLQRRLMASYPPHD